jgi:hypothetical protein
MFKIGRDGTVWQYYLYRVEIRVVWWKFVHDFAETAPKSKFHFESNAFKIGF